VLSTERRGVPACLVHLFAERGMAATELDLQVLSDHQRAHPGTQLPFPNVRYVVADCAGADTDQIRDEVAELRALHLGDEHRDVIVLTDIEVSVPVDKDVRMCSVTTLAELLRATGARAENPLTVREREVLTKVAAGATNAQVAHGLGISIGTVKTYLERAQEKTSARDRASTVAVALRNGWL
jgi:DNA-binding CsgD family transcriptional regulator